MNLRNRVIRLERKTPRPDDASEHLRSIEIHVVSSLGENGEPDELERVVQLRLGGEDGTPPCDDGIENLDARPGGRMERQRMA